MPLDPRRVLAEAVEVGSTCWLLPSGGGLVPTRPVRVEPGGLVLVAPKHPFVAGEEIRAWLDASPRGVRFEASVIRVGVPVPDRSQHGIMLGFLDRFEVERAVPEGHLDLLPAGGGAVSLLEPPAALLRIGLRGLVVMLPLTSRVFLIPGARVRLQVGVAGVGSVEMAGLVAGVEKAWRVWLVEISVEWVGNAETHREVVRRIGG